jgi:hypothetical protein
MLEAAVHKHWWHNLTGHWALLVGVGGIALLVWIFGMLTGGGTIQIQNGQGGSTPRSAPLRAMLLGADGRLSTSKTITAAWTVVIGFALITITTMVIAGGGSISDKLQPLSDTYLLLLGAPFAALVLAKGIVVTRLQNGTLQKTPIPPTFQASDLTTNDAGQTDLVDFQFLIFNAIAMAYVLVRFCTTPDKGLPEIPAALAGLTSVSALTYTANKAIADNTPKITNIAQAGAVLTISGVQLGGANTSVSVTIGQTPVGVVSVAPDSTGALLTVQLQRPVAAGQAQVTVSVASGGSTLQAVDTVNLTAVP